MEIYLYYIIASIILLLLSSFVFQPANETLKKMNRYVNRKLIPHKYETLFRLIISSLWWLFALISFYKIYQFQSETRLYITLLFIITIYFLNKIEISLLMVLFSPFEITSKIISKFKKKNNIEKKSISEKVSRFARFKDATILIYSSILLSFSLNFIITSWNFILIGIIIILWPILYLLKSLYDIFRSQKDLLYVSDKLETFQKIMDDIVNDKLLKNMIDSTIKLINSILALRNKKQKESKFEKGIDWSKRNLKKLQYVSKVGFSVFKTYLTLKLIFIVITTIAYFVIVNANYFSSLENVNIISTNFINYTQYLLVSFYTFIGESIPDLIINNSLSFINLYILITGLFGWVLTVLYIVLFFDIITISVNDFYDTANKSVKRIATELLLYLNKIKPDEKTDNTKRKENIMKSLQEMKIDDVDSIVDKLNEIE